AEGAIGFPRVDERGLSSTHGTSRSLARSRPADQEHRPDRRALPRDAPQARLRRRHDDAARADVVPHVRETLLAASQAQEVAMARPMNCFGSLSEQRDPEEIRAMRFAVALLVIA